MIKKRILHSTSAQLIYQAAIEHGLEVNIESTRFNLFSIMLRGQRVFIKGTNVPLNSQSSSLITHNKFLSKKIFKQNAILTPKSWLVPTIKKARELIIKRDIFPCVIKPIDGAHGNDVYANIETVEELDEVLNDFSKQPHDNILIEEHIIGVDYRILVIGNMISAVVERTPAHVIGDGKSTIKELIKAFNKNPLIGKKHEKPMCKILINFELTRTLKKSSLKLTSIVRQNKVVFLKQNANISAGGISTDVTADINQSSTELAIRAARAIGMEFCGVDILYNKESNKSYVLEVNDCPGIDIHHFPVNGDSQNVAGDVIKYLVSKNAEKILPDDVLLPFENTDLNIVRQTN